MRQKKYRDKTGLFVAEGPKLISELVESGLTVRSVFSLEASPENADNHFEISKNDLGKISGLKSPNAALAVFEKPRHEPIEMKGLILALDAVRDPGNLGTIIRLCDWFGIYQLVCSPDTADCFNPKVIQATMGSIGRVNVHYTELKTFLDGCDLPVYGAVMDGTNVYKEMLHSEAVLVMGNEANGISSEIQNYISKRITIPRYGELQVTESLNVATATAVLISEFRRSTGR